MDYEALLKKYMAKVIDCEGVSFANNDNSYDVPDFTDEELKVLQRIQDEARKEYNL